MQQEDKMNLTHEEQMILLGLLDAKIEAMQNVAAALSLRNRYPKDIEKAKEAIERLKTIRQKVAEA